MLPAALALLTTALPVMAQQFSSLEERMSAADFKAAGLDKLTPQELQNLDNWLRTHEQTRMVSASGQPVFYPTNQPRDKFNTHLVGHFNGWAGQTTFTLDNGQIWKQLESDSGIKARFEKGGKNTIVISRGLIGSYNANINDGPTYKVTRVK